MSCCQQNECNLPASIARRRRSAEGEEWRLRFDDKVQCRKLWQMRKMQVYKFLSKNSVNIAMSKYCGGKVSVSDARTYEHKYVAVRAGYILAAEYAVVSK